MTFEDEKGGQTRIRTNDDVDETQNKRVQNFDINNFSYTLIFPNSSSCCRENNFVVLFQ